MTHIVVARAGGVRGRRSGGGRGRCGGCRVGVRVAAASQRRGHGRDEAAAPDAGVVRIEEGAAPVDVVEEVILEREQLLVEESVVHAQVFHGHNPPPPY